jgi:hypothetical protein
MAVPELSNYGIRIGDTGDPASLFSSSASRGGCSEAGCGGTMRPGVWLYWAVVGLSGLSLLLVATYIVLVQDNRSVQLQVNQRQQFINQSIQLGRVNDVLIRALAAAAVNSNDDRLRNILAQSGITINAAGEPEKVAPQPPAGTAR